MQYKSIYGKTCIEYLCSYNFKVFNTVNLLHSKYCNQNFCVLLQLYKSKIFASMLIYVQYLTTNNKVIKGTAFYPWIMLPKFLITHLPSNSRVGRDNYHRFLLERSGREGSETLLRNSFISSSVVPSLLSLPWHRISHHFKPRPVQTQPC